MATLAFSSTGTMQYRWPALPMIWFSSISARKGYASSMAWSAADSQSLPSSTYPRYAAPNMVWGKSILSRSQARDCSASAENPACAGGISVSPDGLPGFFLSAIPDNASSSAPISVSSDPVPGFPFCAQAQRDSIRTSVRKYVITCFGILFITAPFKRHHSIPWHKRGSLRPQWGGSDPHSGCVIRCCPAWALLLRSMADTSHDSSMGDLPLWRRPKRFPTDAGICHR